MAYTVPLFNSNAPSYAMSPKWWRNFIRGNAPGHRYNREETNNRLLEYSASYVVMTERNPPAVPPRIARYVDFYDEAAYTWFVLRWS